MHPADTDKTISDNSLSQWLKIKIGDRYDDSEQVIFSPPHEDDSFFFIPYELSIKPPKIDKIELDSRPSYTNQNLLSDSSANFKMKRSSTVPDSQFKAAAAEEESRGGLSMINNMLSGKLFGSYLPAENKQEDFTYRNRQRRNSKSLPASPLSSPKIYRKNPYFTDPFARPDETFEPGRTGLILSILSQRKSVEDLIGKTNASNPAATITDINHKSNETYSPQIPRHTPKHYEPIPKPSELREMNFWSPVSM